MRPNLACFGGGVHALGPFEAVHTLEANVERFLVSYHANDGRIGAAGRGGAGWRAHGAAPRRVNEGSVLGDRIHQHVRPSLQNRSLQTSEVAGQLESVPA